MTAVRVLCTLIKTGTGGILAADPAQQPALFALSKLYPNPVSLVSASSINIEFNVAKSGPVNISVLSALGREVADIASGFYDSGTWNVRWQPGATAPGVYYVRLQTASGTMVRSVVLH